ncbi:hypothetical protein ACF0H5_023991 [Mactra antiquata]
MYTLSKPKMTKMNADALAEFSDSIEAKYEGLRMFTLKTLASERKKTAEIDKRLSAVEQKLSCISMCDVQGLNESIDSMKEDVDDIKRKRTLNSPEYDNVTSPEPVPQKRAGCSGIVPDRPCIPTTLNDIADPNLRTCLGKYYTESLASPEKLTPVQLAFVQYFLFEKNSGKGSGEMYSSTTTEYEEDEEDQTDGLFVIDNDTGSGYEIGFEMCIYCNRNKPSYEGEKLGVKKKG